MQLTITRINGDAAKKLASELSEQAGGPRGSDVAFDTLLARARSSSAARKRK